MPGVGSTVCGWITGGSSPGQGVKPTDASCLEPLVTVVPQRGATTPDPAAELAATAPMITVTARASEIVAVLDAWEPP